MNAAPVARLQTYRGVMRIVLALAILAAAASVAAADMTAPFVSPGVAISWGSRGLTFGVEVSAGYYDDHSGVYGGGAGGFEIAPFADVDQPWGRAYFEGELGWIAFGSGIGPVWLFGPRGQRLDGIQLTPYVSFSPDLGSCGGREPFVTTTAFYRYTNADEHTFHDAGLFLKQLWFANGVTDHGICE